MVSTEETSSQIQTCVSCSTRGSIPQITDKPKSEVISFFTFLDKTFHLGHVFSKVILLTAIESPREKKKKTKKKKPKNKSQTADDISKGSTPRSASQDVASVETAKAWSDHSDVKSGYQWISGLKILGK